MIRHYPLLSEYDVIRIEPFSDNAFNPPLISVFFLPMEGSGGYDTAGLSLFDFCGVLKRDLDLASALLG
jgi:hypothetical protein